MSERRLRPEPGPAHRRDEWVARSGERAEVGGDRGAPARPVRARAEAGRVRVLRRRGRARAAAHGADRQRHLLPQGRDGGARLRAPRAGLERRRRIRGAPRSRLHRLLRDRRVRVRVAVLGQVRDPLGGVARDPARRRGLRSARAPARASVAPSRRRLPRDRDALLRADLLRHRDQGYRVSFLGPEQGSRLRPGELGPHGRPERDRERRSARRLRPRPRRASGRTSTSRSSRWSSSSPV